MTIDKAIEMLELELRMGEYEQGCDIEDALKLGIEALKEAQRWRAGQPLHLPNLLLGETED